MHELPPIESLRRRTLRLSIVEGLFYAVMVGTSETFVMFYAVKQGLNEREIGIVATAPVLLGAIANWVFPMIVREKFLKPAILSAISIQILGLLGLFGSVYVAHPFQWIFASLCLYWIGGMASTPFWLDWMIHWLPPERWGRYLSRRTALVALAVLAPFLATASIVYRISSIEIFKWLFLVAAFARFISLLLLSVQASPHPLRRKKQMASTPLSVWKSPPILLTIIFTILFRFVSNIASPYFPPYMIHQLKFPLLYYAILTAVPFIGRSLFLARWGEAIRTFRPFIGLQIAMFMISLICLLWTLTRNLGVLCSIEVFSGIFWGGFELATVLIIQSFSPGNSRTLIGLHVVLMNTATIGGALLGAEWLQQGFSYHDIFRASSFLRFAVTALFVVATLRLSETKTPIRVYGEFFTSIMSIRPSLTDILGIERVRRKPIKKTS